MYLIEARSGGYDLYSLKEDQLIKLYSSMCDGTGKRGVVIEVPAKNQLPE